LFPGGLKSKTRVKAEVIGAMELEWLSMQSCLIKPITQIIIFLDVRVAV